jgi:hypothetical protein
MFRPKGATGDGGILDYFAAVNTGNQGGRFFPGRMASKQALRRQKSGAAASPAGSPRPND